VGKFAAEIKKWNLPGKVLACLLIVLTGIGILRAGQVCLAENHPKEAYLVLGGCPLREVFVAQLVLQHPDIPVLISTGDPDPCIWLIFDKAKAPKDKVWMEHCSKNTFDNFVYSIPILESWGIQKVYLVTDRPQNKRAMRLAKVLMPAHGMQVELVLAPEFVNDNRPEWLIKCAVAYSCLYALTSQFYQPHCSNITHLSEIDMDYWNKTGFDCQQQCELKGYPPYLMRKSLSPGN